MADYRYNVNVVDVVKRRKIIKENLKKKLSHKESFKIKNRWVACPIVLLDIDVPVYHLNNGRTRDRQRTYIKENKHKDNYFEKGLENNQQQRQQHKILVDLSQDPTANIYKELRSSIKFREDAPLLIDSNGMLINGNRRMAAIRELYKSDVKKYDGFKRIPCAVIEQHLDDLTIKEIENFLQVIKENKQDYSWVSLCMEIQDERKRLGLNNKQIGVNMGKTEKEIERYFNLITIIDDCLDKDHRTPGDYSKIKNQEQLWKNTIERAERQRNKGDKDLIYKIARIISVNSGKFEDRDYQIASALQKKNNLKQVLNYLTSKYTSIKTTKNIKKDENDPLRGLRRVEVSSSIDPSIVNQIPVKRDDEKQRAILLGAIETLEQAGDNKASLNYSVAALQKIETMNSLRFPEIYKDKIKKNLNDIIRKAQRIIKDKKL
tara:strand:+ start:949 stop:2247 length:1299 start_codon:yes stop_codon:yes gene_type:complete